MSPPQALTDILKPLADTYIPTQGDAKIVVGVTVKDRQFFLFFGPSKTSVPIDEDSIFEIGASSMAFTACLLTDMVGKREVRLDDPVKKYLPAGVSVPAYREQEITLLDLANHTSGLPRLPFNFFETVVDLTNPCKHYSVGNLYAFLSSNRLRYPIGWRRSFSNLGMGLLGHVLERAANQTFQEALAERICAPLNLRNTAVSLTAAQHDRLVPGHSATGESASAWDMPTLVGAGGVRSTARDLLLFLRTYAAEGSLLGKCLVPRLKSGRPSPWVLRYGAAASLSGLALATASYFAMAPATGLFLGVFFLPVLVSALFGGLGPGVMATVNQTLGAAYLLGESFNGAIHGLAGLALAWVASSQHRERARRELLGWMHGKPGLLGRGQSLVWQSGETGGYASFIGLDPKRDVAVVALANCAKPVSEIGYRALKFLTEE